MFFTRKQDQSQIQGYLRRICDRTSPNLPRLDESRGDSRQNRTFPILLTPWENGAPNGHWNVWYEDGSIDPEGTGTYVDGVKVD